MSAARFIAAARTSTVEELADSTSARLDEKCYTVAPTGGTPASQEHLASIAEQLRGIARASGYPNLQRKVQAQRRFDVEATMFLHEKLEAPRGELLRDEVWQYLTCVVTPDLVVWRFGNSDDEGTIVEERFLGGVRNNLGRLWRRADLLRDGSLPNPWALVDGLLEDNFVAIIERPRIARNPKLAREVARAFLLRRELVVVKHGPGKVQGFLRDIMKRIIRVNVHQALGALEPDELQTAMGRLADDSLRSMGVAPEKEERLVEQRPGLGVAPQATRVDESDVIVPLESISLAAEPSSEPPLPELMTLDTTGRVKAVWEAVIGLGSRSADDIVRLAAEALRQRGQVEYERLRETGAVYQSIAVAIEAGRNPRYNRFDVPLRGQRRAKCLSVEDVPQWLWARLIRDVGSAIEDSNTDAFMKALASALDERLGLSIHPQGMKALCDMLIRDRFLIARGGHLFVPSLVDKAPEDIWWGWRMPPS